MKKITFMLFMMLLSLCGYAQLAPEAFETWPVPGWASYQNNIGTTTVWQQGQPDTPFAGVGNTHSAYIASQPVPPPGQPEDYLVTKSFTVPLAPKLMFNSKFIVGANQGNLLDIRIVKVADNATGDPAAGGYQSIIDDNGYTELEMNPNQQAWTAKKFDVPAQYINQQVYICFVYKSVNSTERWLIDDVRVVEECLMPTFTLSNPTITSIQVNITANPSNASTFYYEWILATGAPTGVPNGSFSGTTGTITGIPEDTDVKVYIWAECGPGNRSEPVGPVTGGTIPAGTNCAAPKVVTALPYQTTDNTSNYGDDTTLEGSPGAAAGCGTSANYLNGNEVVYQYTATFTGNLSIVMTNNGPASGMFVYTSCADIGVNCVAGGIGNATTPVAIPSLAVTSGQVYYIVISTSGSTMSTPYTLTIQAASCAPPTNLAIVPGSIGPNDVSFSFTDNPAILSWQYVVQPAGTGIPTPSSTVGTTGSTTTPVGGLAEATAHEIFVRGDCGNGTFSAWTGPINFTTTQVPATLNYTQNFETAPHNFTLSNGNQVNKWVVGNATNNGGAQSLYISNNGGASHAYTTENAASTVHAFRDIAIPTGTSEIQLTFDWKGEGEAPNHDYFKVWSVPTDFNPIPGTLITASAGNRVQIGGMNNSQANWTTSTYVVDVNAFQGANRRIVFEWRNDGGDGDQPPAAIDNINISMITCGIPRSLAVTAGSVTQNSATITWNTPLYSTPQYDYYYSTSNTPPTGATTPTQSNITGLTANLTGLESSTVYYVWIRSNCGTVNGVSNWIGPVSFNTLQIPATVTYQEGFEATHGWTFTNGSQTNKWMVGTATNNGGAKSLYVSNDNAANAYTTGTSSVVHAYRDIQIPAQAEQMIISFDWKAVGEEIDADRLRVYLVPLTFNPTAGTQITANTQNVRIGQTNYNMSPTWQNSFNIVPGTAYQGQVRRLVFEWRNDAGGGAQPPAAVDNINISVISCPSPTAVTLGAVTPTSAVVNWTAPLTVTPSYDFYVSTNISNVPVATTTPTGNVTTNTVTLDDEIPAGSTNFYFWVRSNCGNGDNGYWTGPLQIGLPQVPTNLNIQDNLEGAIGWTVNNGTQTNKWVVGSATSSSPSTSLYISNNNGVTNTYATTTGSTTHVYRDFTIPAGTTDIGVSFDWKAFGEDADDRLRVWLVPNTFTPTPGTQIAAGTNRKRIGGEFSGSAVWKNETFVFSEAANVGTTRRLIFEWRNDGSGGQQPPAAVDNINVRVITCPAVTNLQANGTGVIGDVTLSWTPVGTETQWEVVVQPDTAGHPGDNPPAAIVTVVNGTPSHTVTVPAGVIYEFYVRPVCAPNDKGFWAGPQQFSVFAPPACALVNMYDEDLELITNGSNLSICPGEDACVDLSAQFLQTGSTTSYAVETIPYAPQFPFTGGTEMNINQDDIWAAPEQLPANFNFCFFGQKQTSVQVGSNGVIKFGTPSPAGSNCPWSYSTTIPNTGFPILNAIYGVYQDIDPRVNNDFANPTINYQVLGTYPCRAFVVNYSELAQYSGACEDDPTVGAQTSQIVFYEISNIVEVYVKRRVPCNSWQSGRGVIGIQNATGTVAFTPPGRNTGNWTAIEEAYRFVPNGPSNVQFEWLKDGQLYSNNPAIEVCVSQTQPTVMKARATYTGCGNSTPVTVESTVTITPEQPIIVTQTTDLQACVANPGDSATFDLTDGIENGIVNPQNYTFSFYETEALAIAGNTADQLPTSYATAADKTIWVRVQLTGRTCFVTDSFELNVDQGPLYDISDDITICQGTTGTISISDTNFDQADPTVTYSWTWDTNPLPDTGSSLIVSDAGTYELTVSKGGCSNVQSVVVTVVNTPVVDVLPDVSSCESYTLQPLTTGNNYYTGPGGTGTQLTAGTVINTTQEIYVRVEGATPGCNSEDSFMVTIVPKPVLTVPGDVTVCVTDGYQLPALTVGNYYDAPGGTGNIIPAGQVITANQTIYVYATSPVPTIQPCVTEGSFNVTVVPQLVAQQIGNQVACNEYQLPALDPNNSYYTATGGPNGTGTLIAPATMITNSQTVYVFAQAGSCSDESSFTVTIVPEPLEIGIAEGCDNGRYMLSVVFNNGETNYNNSNVTFAWSRTEGGPVIGTGSSFHAQATGDYYVTVSPAGSSVSCYQTGHVNVVDITCMIQRGISPNGDGLNDSFDLTAFNVRKLSIFNRYGKEVYSFGNYTDQWHGQGDNGHELPTGTYFYMFERANGENATGWIYINREEK